MDRKQKIALEDLKKELIESGVLTEEQVTAEEHPEKYDEKERCKQKQCVNEELFVLALRKRGYLKKNDNEKMFRALAQNMDEETIIDFYTIA